MAKPKREDHHTRIREEKQRRKTSAREKVRAKKARR